MSFPYNPLNAKTKLEQILEIFCQDYVSDNTEQLLEFDDYESRSEEFRELARPLVYAVSDPEVRKIMTVEDEMSFVNTNASNHFLICILRAVVQMMSFNVRQDMKIGMEIFIRGVNHV